jgi:hypothetical protein
MRRVALISAALLGCLVFASGCAVGRRTLTLDIPQTPGLGTAKGSIYIGEIVDSRHFENKPSNPATPSIDGDVTKATKAQLAIVVGRMRNGFGGALGDIGLPDNDTVMQRTRLLLAEGFRRKGYAISTDATAATSATASIDEFWAWVSPGMWTLPFEANVACRVTLKNNGTETTFTVRGYAVNRGGAGTSPNWEKAFQGAFADFLVQLDAQLTKAGL